MSQIAEEILTRDAIRWFKCKLKPSKKEIQVGFHTRIFIHVRSYNESQ